MPIPNLTKFLKTNQISVDKRKSSALISPAGPMVTVEPSKTLTLLWGATGEQEWTPALTTGTKSLFTPKPID